MFKETNRYITSGVNESIEIRLQLTVWTLIDELKLKENVELDYLQVFRLKKENGLIKIEHTQEVPEYKSIHMIQIENIELLKATKVFVIDSGDYSIMLLPEEY